MSTSATRSGCGTPRCCVGSSLPAAAPAIWDTLRITLGWAWTWLVMAELVAALDGLGHRIIVAQRYFQTDTIFVGILVIGRARADHGPGDEVHRQAALQVGRMNEPKLSVKGVRKVFEGRAGDVVALDGVDFEIAEKEFVTCRHERLRQVDAALDHRRARGGDRGGRAGRRRGGLRAGPRPRHRLPALHAVPVDDCAEERRVRAPRPSREPRATARESPRAPRAGRPRGVRGRLSEPALGRHAAAGRDRPGALLPAARCC